MGLELICVGISMVVGILLGEILGVADWDWGNGSGLIKVARRVGIVGLVVVGRG